MSKEFTVQTECGRNFIWSALDLDHCLRSVVYAGYRATFIEEYTEYQADVHKIEQQEVLNAELTKVIDGGEAA